MDNFALNEFTKIQNSSSVLFTPGPAPLLPGNIENLGPCFGRGDFNYDLLEDSVLSRLSALSNHAEVIRMQGSATFALDVIAQNFLYGRVVVVVSGFYGNRLRLLVESAMALGNITDCQIISHEDLKSYSQKCDWIFSCFTETSSGLKISASLLHKAAIRCGAQLALDATASIGLESQHDVADVIAYSSCKGLFGLTGASFVAFNKKPESRASSFYLSFDTHYFKKVTGPYHQIQSLYAVLDNHSSYVDLVRAAKDKFCSKFADFIIHPSSDQPLLCTTLSVQLFSKDRTAILYEPRELVSPIRSITCHFSELHLDISLNGTNIDNLEVLR